MHASCIIKLGGSLLDLPDLPLRLKNFLADFSRPRKVLLAGGGEVVEQLRRWDRVYAIGEEPSHWIALRALTINALVLERVVPSLRHVESTADLASSWDAGRIPMLDAYRFIKDVDEHSRDPLPRRWRVTSDSIAARMATALGAPEVILLKSVTVEPGTTMTLAAQRGIVDPHFPVAAQSIAKIVAVNLRENEPREVELIQG